MYQHTPHKCIVLCKSVLQSGFASNKEVHFTPHSESKARQTLACVFQIQIQIQIQKFTMDAAPCTTLHTRKASAYLIAEGSFVYVVLCPWLPSNAKPEFPAEIDLFG